MKIDIKKNIYNYFNEGNSCTEVQFFNQLVKIKRNLLVIILFLTNITGCSDIPFINKPKEIPIFIQTSNQLNSNEKSNSNPLLIKVFQLSAIDNFQEKSFLSLYHDARSELGSEIVYLEDIVISPDEKKEIVNTHGIGTKYIAFLFAYHNYQNSTHKLWIDISKKIPKQIFININNNNPVIKCKL